MAKISKALVLLLGTVIGGVGREPATLTRCDINQDGSINVVDVENVIDEVLGLAQATDDLNGDGVVNVTDVQMEVVAALGLGCLAGPHTYAIGGVPISIENSVSPVAAGPRTFAVSGVPVSIENSVSPVVPGTQTFAAGGLLFSILNSASPATAGSQTFAIGGLPYSILNSASPVAASPQTYYVSGLRFSLFNGLVASSFPSALLAPSLRFLVPVDPAFLAEALARGAQRINGKPVCLDSDGDGLCDADELIIGTSPFMADSDGDGYPDGLELALGSDPLDPKSIPDIRPPGYYATPPVSVQNIIPMAILIPRKQGAFDAANSQ